MKIVFVSSSMNAGGAERVISIMANYWAKYSWAVSIITLSDVETDFYKLHSSVKRIGLALRSDSRIFVRGASNNLRRIAKLRSTLNEINPDAVISFCDKVNILTLLASIGLKLNVIVSERTDPSVHEIGKLWGFLRRCTYPYADSIVCQNETVAQWLYSFTSVNRVNVIPNPVLIQNQVSEGSQPLSLYDLVPDLNRNDKLIMAMGRLSHEKGFDLLINAMKLATTDIPGWSLVILGDGPLKDTLRSFVVDMGLKNRVYFTGLVHNPASLLVKADIFVLSSRYEGFPNALCEAMACGLPVISFDCPSGPRAIIRDGVDGMLIPSGNVEALAKAMQTLMKSENERERLSIASRNVLKRFGIEAVMSMWEEAIRTA